MKEKMLPKRHRWLIIIDLDGTLLKSKFDNINFKIHPKNIEAITKLINIGHKVAIVTGRPWSDTKKIYNALGLTTIVGNYNGALIDDPNDSGFVKMSTSINRNIIKELINLAFVKKYLTNIIIEDEIGPAIWKKEDKIMDQFHIKNNENIRLIKSKTFIEQNPYSVIIEFNCSKDKTNEIFHLLKRKYGSALNMRFWNREENHNIFCLEINTYAINKAMAAAKIAAYYNIPMHRTIAFGDGLNDIEMLSSVAYGVAMKNATEIVKTYAKDVTDFSNNDGGVGHFLLKFFEYDLK